MANTIQLSQEFIPNLDEVYQLADLTADLNGSNDEIIATNVAGEYKVAKYSMDGLKDYDRNSGYKDGNVNLEWETLKADYDRGTKFMVDSMDDAETMELAFGKLAAEFVRTKVVPEANAYTFAKLAGTTGITALPAKTLSTGQAVLNEIIDAESKLDEDEVPAEGRILYISSTLLNSIKKENNLTNTWVLEDFEKIVKVPQRRFYTGIKLNDGSTAGEEAGHYVKATDAKDINFMIVQKDAIVKHDKHTAADIIPKELNPSADGNILKYRKYGIVDVYENKVAGVVLSHEA